MKKKFTLKIFKLKKRYFWFRNPVTKIKKSGKIYRREREKEKIEKEIEKE